jgi:Ham1 family protein
MKRLLYATGNKYKIESMRERVKGIDIEIISPNDLNIKLNVVEDGKTVVENAQKKLRYIMMLLKYQQLLEIQHYL